MTNPTLPPTPQSSPDGPFKAVLTGICKRHHLTPIALAEYLGVSVSAARSWLTTGQVPGSSVIRLIEVLATIEALAPDLHERLLPAHRGYDKPGRPKGTK